MVKTGFGFTIVVVSIDKFLCIIITVKLNHIMIKIIIIQTNKLHLTMNLQNSQTNKLKQQNDFHLFCSLVNYI